MATTTPEFILALDLPEREHALRICDLLQPEIQWVKVGYQMFCHYGVPWLEELHQRGLNVFLDLKLHDIPNTVAEAIAQIASLPVQMTTLHCLGGVDMLSAARESANKHNPQLKLIGVTLLTSHRPGDFEALGGISTHEELIQHLAKRAVESQLDGFVSAPTEATHLRPLLPHGLFVTPGIRPAGADVDDQARAATPGIAAQSGATHLVVGRPILKSATPLQAYRDMMAQARVGSTSS